MGLLLVQRCISEARWRHEVGLVSNGKRNAKGTGYRALLKTDK